jgi:hypothetical protein
MLNIQNFFILKFQVSILDLKRKKCLFTSNDHFFIRILTSEN